MQVVMEMRDYQVLEGALMDISDNLLNPNASKQATVERLRERNDYAWAVAKRALARLEVA
jgi:hypothetical protein